MEKTEWVRLRADCGAPIFVWYNPQNKSVAISTVVLTGACDERGPEEAGLAHATEHMLFQSTKRFSSSQKLTKIIESCGGKLNAVTWLERTYFYCVLPVEFTKRGFVYLSEMTLNPLFELKKIEVEMKSVIQEIKQSENNPSDVARRAFFAAIYGNHPFAKPVLGTKESVMSFRRKDFLKWHKRFYYPDNFAFVIAGGLEPQKAKDLIDKFFNAGSSGLLPNKRKISADLVGITPRFLFTPRNDWQQTHILAGTAVAEGNSADVRALDFFTDMISGLSGPLFQEVRDKRGLAYAVTAAICVLKLLSSVYIHIGTDPSKSNEVIEIVRKVIDKNKNSKSLFKSTKTRILGAAAIHFDSMSPALRIASAIDSIIIRGRPIVFEDMKKEVESVTLEQVEASVNKYLSPNKLTTVVIGPEDNPPHPSGVEVKY